MDTILNILRALDVNQTIAIQFGIFLVMFLFLRLLVFKPYFAAYEARKGATAGNNEQAEHLITQTRELETVFQNKSRHLNADIKGIYDKARIEANKEQEKIMAEAREKARLAIEKARGQIQDEMNRAREELTHEIPAIGAVMADRLLSPGGPN